MAIIKKYLFDEKLESYGVFIEDTAPNSDYFKITELPDVFSGGKNAFLIQGSAELDSDSIVKVQIRDSEGNIIYHEPGEGIPEYYEGTSKVISVYIYPDTSFGPCTITILGELKEYKDSNGITIPIPENWKDIYNVRWQKEINVNPLLNNTTKIRFYRRPKISITESVLPVYSITFNRQTISGSINGFAVNPEEGSDFRTFKGDTLYELRITGSLFSSSMEGETISITGLNKTYETTIKEVVNSNKVLATIPYYETSSNDSTSYQNILSFSSKPFTIEYNVSSTLSNSSVSSSFAKIKISDLETFSGDVNRVKIYASRVADIGSYTLLEDIKLESNELFLEDLFSGSVGVRTGIFSNQTIVDSFWKYIDYGSSNTYSKNIDNNLLVSSVKLEDAGTQNLTEFPQRLFYNTSLLDFTKNTEYQIDFTPLLSSSVYPYNKISVYASGSAFANSSDSLPIGKLVGEIDTNDTFTKFDKQQFNFKPESDGTGNIVFAIQQGNWHLSNISLRSSQETNFSPNELTLNVNIPTKVNYDTYDFKFEFYDINNNYVPVNVNKEFTFVGGSDSFATKDLILTSDLNLFSFSGSSPAIPIGASSTQFNIEKIGLTGSVTYFSSAFDNNGNYINPSSYIGGQYPGLLTNVTATNATLTATNFTGSNNSINVSRILYTASCEGVQDTLNIYRFDQGAQGVDGANAVQYVIVPQNGTILKNSSGSLELQLSRIDGTSVIELTTGNIKLVTGSSNTIINTGNGITNGGNGASYNPIIDSTKISGSLLIKAYDFDTNTVLDSITLADVSDGLSAGAINSSNGLTFVRETNNGNFINPANTKLTASFFLPNGQEISESVLITPNYTAGNDTFTYAMLQDNPNIGLVVKASDGTTLSAGSPTNTRTISTTFTYSSIRVSETLNILVDGVNGTGANASVVNLVSPYYIISYDTNGNLISPSATFPVTASSQNFTTPYFKFTGDIDSPDSVYSIGSGNSDTASFTPPSTYFSIPKNIRVGVSEASQTEVAFDTISIAAVRVGSSGDNPQYYYIQSLSGSQIRNSQGTLELQAVWISGSISRNLKSGSIVFATGSTSTSLLRTGSGIFGGSQINSGPNSYLWNTTINSTGISGSKIVYLIDTGSNTVYDTITLLDTTDGVAGGSIIANSLITRRDPVANTYSPTSLSATASFFGTNGLEYTAKLTVVPVWETNLDKLYYTIQSSASAILVQADDGDGNQFVSGSLANRLTTKDINFKFTFTDPQTGDTSKINETFYIISDGADGDDAYTVVLTNDSHTLPTNTAGDVTYTNSGTSIIAYRGTTELNGITTGVPTSGQFSASVIIATGIITGSVSSPGNPIVIADHNSMTADLATIYYTVNLEGTQSLTKIQTLSKAKQGATGNTGATGAAGKVVNLDSPYYVISYDKDGNISSPNISQLIVTASAQNFSNPYFKFIINGSAEANWTPGSGSTSIITSSLDTASVSIDSTYFSVPKTIKVSVAESASVMTEVAFDTINVAAVRVGSSGDNPQYYYIKPLSGSQIRNSQGTLEIQAVWVSGSTSRDLKSGSIVFTTASVSTASLRTGSGVFGGSQTNTGPNSYLWNATLNSTGISGSRVIYLYDTGLNRLYDTITLLDTTDGVAGGSVVANSLITRRDPVANTYLPTALPATASFFGTNGLEYTASFTVYPYFESNLDKLYYTVQSSASAIIMTADDGDGNQFVSGSLANRLTTKDINFKFTFTDPQTGDTSKINETFYIISDGADGDDAYTVVLTNDSHTLPTTNTGTVTYTNSGTSILAYRGTTELNGIITGVPTSGQFSASAITATNITPGTLTSPGNPLVVSDHNSMTSDIATISYTLNLEGTQSFTKIQTFSKARQGGDGLSNVSYVIAPISGTILKNKSGTLELQIARLSGSRYDYISGGTIVLVTGSANTTITAGDGISAGANGVSYNAIFDSTKISGSLIVRARDTSANITYDTITLADITDGVAAGGINSTDGLILVRNPNNNNTYTPSTTKLTASFYDVNGKQYTSSLLVTPNFTTTDQLRYTTGISDSNMVLEVRDVLGNVMTNNTYVNTIGLNVRYTFTDPVSKDVVDAIETVRIASDGAKGLVFFADASKTQFVFDPDDNNKPALLYDYTDIFLKRNFNSGSSTFRIISGSTMPPLTLINTTFVGEFTQSIYRLYTGTSAESATSWSYNTPSTTTRTGTYVFTQANFSSSVDISGVLKGSGSKNLDVTSNANQFFYKMTDRSLSPTGQTITMLAKRNNLGNPNAIITVTSGSGLPPLAVGSTTNGVTSYSISGTNYAFLSGSTTYTFTAPDLNASTYTDTITITPVLLPSQINVIASNENATLPANGYGFVASSSFVATSGSLSVKVGSDSILYASPLVSNSFSASISASFGVTGANVVSPGTYSITRLDADSGSLLLKVSYADGIGSQSIFTKDITYTKAKNAVPTTIALLSSETQTVLSSSTIAAPSTFTVSVNEGGSNYTYDAALSVVNTFYISSITGGTNASAVVTPTTPTSDSGTNVALTVSYRNSINGTGTINKNHIVSVSKKGDIGTTGNTGADGRRTATGMIHYQLSSGTIPSTPSATTYTFSSNTFASLTANWGVGAPIFSGSNSSKYWYSTYTAVETTAGGGTAVPTFSTPSQAIGFTGLVTFTSTDKITDGTNTTNIASTSSVTNHIGGPNVTTINGGKISTGVITSTGYTLPVGDTLAIGTYTDAGTIFNLDNGSLRSKNFYIDSSGNLVLRGSVTITGGNAATTGALSGSLTTANNLAISASVSASNAVTSGSAFASNAVTSGSNAAANAVTSGSAFASNAVTSGSNAAANAVTSGSNAAARAAASASLSGSVDPLTQQLTKIPTPAGSGLYLGSNFLGYYKNGAGWNTFMSSSGDFFLSGSGATFLTWQNGLLTIAGAINVTGGTAATSAALTSSLGLVATNSALSSSFSATNAALTSSFGIQSTSASIAGLTARALAYGKVLNRDATFIDSTNGTTLYNNNGGTAVVLSYQSPQTDSPNSGTSGRELAITYNTATSLGASPGFGGFTFSTPSRPNAIFVTKIIAKIPVGRYIGWHSNAIGSPGQSQQWLTDVYGTGQYQEYISYVKCGSTGTFSLTNYFAIEGGLDSTFTWYVSFATVYDVTDNDIRTIEGIIATSGSVNPASQRITKAATPGATGGGSGLYLGNNNLGYYNGSNWTTYMDSSGNFYLGGTGGSLQWNAGTNALSISGKITVNDPTSNVATNSSLTSSLNAKYDASNPTGYQNNTSARTGGSAGGWTIDGDSIFTGTKDTSGYSVTGITLFSGGSIHAPQFYIDTSGNAFFKGDITGASGTFSGTVTVGGTTLTTANTLNSNITSGNVTGALGYIPPTAANVTSSISQITIGGRNLLLNSQPIVYNQIVGGSANSSTITVDTTNLWKGQPTLRVDGNGGFRFLNNPIIEPYTEYIASMMVKADSSFAGSQTYPLHIQVPAGGHSHEVLGDYDQTVTTDWKQIWLRFRSNQTTNTTFQLYLYNIGTTLFNVAWAKLEKGNKQTDWTPAPEDIASGSIGNVDILGAGVLNYNPDFSISTVDGKPAGALASFSSTDNSIISFLDSNRNALKLSSPSDTTIGVTMPAIKLNKDARYNITFRVKSNATQTNGFYFRMGEIDVELPQGYTNISIYTGATGVYSTGVREVFSGAGLTVVTGTSTEYGPLTTSYVTYEITYVPTTTAKWASPLFLKYDDIPTSGELHIDRLTIQQDTSIKTQGSVGGWTINSSQIFSGTAGSDGAFNAGAGITLGGSGYISSKNFYIDSSGNAKFNGSITFGAGGAGINVAPIVMRYDPRDGNGLSSANYDNVTSLNGLSTENAIDYRTDPFGNKSLVWQCYPSGNGNDDGGWNSTQFRIDNTKTYKYIIYVKRYTSLVSPDAGNTYWGPNEYNDVNPKIRNLSDSSLNINPYFYSGVSGLSLNKWYLIVAYVYGSSFVDTSDDRGGVYDCDTGQKVTTTVSFKWDSSATVARHRAYLFYNSIGNSSTLYQEFFNPAVYEVDGTEPDLNRLLDKGKMVGNGSYSGGTFIDGRTFYAPNISGSTGDFTGKITATSGEIGGWVIDSDKLYSPPSGSNNVIKMKLEPNSINPQFSLSDGAGLPAVVIKTGQLLDAAAGAANITVDWDVDKSGFTAGTTTGDLFETKYNTAEAFTVSATGLYTGTITLTARNAFTPLASGYYRYEVGAIITDDAGIGNILYQSSISLIDSFSQIGVQKVFPARTKTVEVTFNSTGTYYIVSYWQRLVTGDEPSATFNTVSHDFPTFTLSKSTSYTELTDFGFQSIRSSTRFVKIQRVGSSDTMLNVGGDIEATGNITAYSSDMRLKTNINILQNPLEKLSKLNGFTYNWNDRANELVGYDTNESIVGMFAQDVQEVLPEAVRIAPFDSDGEGNSKSGENYLTVQYEKVVPLLVEAIKELKKEIEELKTQINKK